MNLELTEDQQMLKDMVDRFVADQYDFEARQSIVRSSEGWSREVWRELADLGLLLLPVAERDGGMGGQGVETMIVSEAFGRALVGEPWIATLLSTAVLSHADDATRANLLGPLMAGELVYAFAHSQDGATTMDRITGSADVVLSGGIADRLLVLTRGDSGLARIVLVDAAALGVSRTNYALHGGGRASDIVLDNAPILAVIVEGEQAEVATREAHAVGVAAIAADALGAAQAAFDLTVDYLKTRVQFGQPIGTNQALQHRAAEMFVELEQLRSAAILAACTPRDGTGDERTLVSAAVRIVTAKSAKFIGQQCVQLHGGIGVTAEAAVGHYFLRLTASTMLFGDAESNITQLADAGGFVHSTAYWEAA